jgi:putative ABC transport system ATP-binding protein
VLDVLAQLSHRGLTLVVITHDERVAGRAHRRVRIMDGELTELADDLDLVREDA